jgi:hypothetical protein
MKNLYTSFILVLFPLIVSGQNFLSEKDLIVLKQPADTMMRNYLTAIVDKQFAARDSLLSTLRSAEDWQARSEAIRDSMISWTGPLPERTPLNARVTGRIERDDYVIEKILFESRPNYFVSAKSIFTQKIFLSASCFASSSRSFRRRQIPRHISKTWYCRGKEWLCCTDNGLSWTRGKTGKRKGYASQMIRCPGIYKRHTYF